MSDHGQHCPFLNRSDARCSTNFSLERLDNAYDYCFGQYADCPVYLELLVERRLRRVREAAGAPRTSRWQNDASEDAQAPSVVAITHGGRRIQLV
ncbi:MAG TPA: hypothetical protein VG326_07720 [Tepidisphaeraceae bacterium]|jgi:hypothetical protein|nr:hypothetical protein [Tepidisphaeraceae bacterium]